MNWCVYDGDWYCVIRWRITNPPFAGHCDVMVFVHDSDYNTTWSWKVSSITWSLWREGGAHRETFEMTTRPMPQPGKLVVRGYGPETTDDEIRTWFEPFGPLEEGRKNDSCGPLWAQNGGVVYSPPYSRIICSGQPTRSCHKAVQGIYICTFCQSRWRRKSFEGDAEGQIGKNENESFSSCLCSGSNLVLLNLFCS